MLQPISSIPMHAVIQERLKEFFLQSGLQPNEQLPSEHELSKKLGASRSAIREALRSLEAIGMIEVRRGKGRYLRQFSFEPMTDTLAYALVFEATSIHDLLEVRKALELSFLPQAAAALTAEDLADLKVVLRNMRSKAETNQPFIEEDMRFHQLLFSRVNNNLLTKLLEVFWRLFKEVHNKNVLPAGETATTVTYHERIVDAIEAGEVSLAEVLLCEHFIDVQRRLASAGTLKPSREVIGKPA